MEHIRIATYRSKEGTTFTDIANQAKDGMLTAFRTEPGFRRYELADLGNGEAVSISLWESREAAERGTTLAKDWVGQNMASKIDLVSNRVGDLAFSEK